MVLLRNKYIYLFIGLLLLVSIVTASSCSSTNNGTYTVVNCTGTGNTTWTFNTPSTVHVLIIGGGGSGGGGQAGYSYGGGGGAGGYLEGILNLTGTYTITVGQGGSAVPASTTGNNGNFSMVSNSSINFTANAGGGGGRASSVSGATNGNAGGSGGGAGGANGARTGGARTQANISPLLGYGNAGGSSTGTANSGGGGGAGSAGALSSRGSGKSSTISGASYTYAAGGYPDNAGTATEWGAGGTGKDGASSAGVNGIVLMEYFEIPIYIAWTQNKSSGSIPLVVQFTDNSTGSQTSWNWSFGDGTYSTSQNPSKTYSTTGIYNVSLNASSANSTNISTNYWVITAGLPPNTISNYKKLYMPMNGTAGSNSLFDLSGYNHTIYSLGNVFINTSQSKFGGSSLWFNNSRMSYAVITANESFDLGANNYYIGWWENMTSTQASRTTVSSYRLDFRSGTYGIANTSFIVGYDGGGNNLQNYVANTTAWDLISGQNMGLTTCATWSYRVSLRNGSSFQTWKDGVLINETIATSAVKVTSGNTLTVGSYQLIYLDAVPFNGFVDDLVIYNGIAPNGSVVPTRELLSNPFADFIASNISGQSPVYVNFTDRSLGNTPISWNWSFGDGTYSNSQSPNHQYNNVGNYSVILNATNQFGSSYATQYINVSSRQIIDFTSNVTSGASPLPIQFNDTSTNSTGWSWFFGDENFTQDVWVQQNISGFLPRYMSTSGMAALPDGSLVFAGGANISGLGAFNDTWRSTDNGVTWVRQNASSGWNSRVWQSVVSLSDGSLVLIAGNDGLVKNDTWLSVDKGITWKLQNSSSGWTARFTSNAIVLPDDTIIITGGSDGTIDYNDTWKSVDKGLTWSRLNASSGWSKRSRHSVSVAPNGDIVLTGGWLQTTSTSPLNDTWISTDKGITWKLQNSSSGWTQRIDHYTTFLRDGTLLLMSGNDRNVPFNATRDMWKSTNKGVTWSLVNSSSDYSYRWASGFSTLRDNSIVMVGGYNYSGVSSDTWRFDPTGSSLQNPVHTYIGSKQVFNVTLQAFNTFTYNSTQKVSYISLYNQSFPNFTTNSSYIVVPPAKTVAFNGTNSSNATLYNWSFHDGTWQNGTAATAQNATMTYYTGGNFTVNLTTFDTGFGSNTQYGFINVYNQTVSGFSANIVSGVEPLPVLFNVITTNDNATMWNWSFGDGTWQNSTTQQNATHTYITGGIYTVTEIASNEFSSSTTERVVNGGFETGDMTGWSRASVNSTATTLQHHTGLYSAKSVYFGAIYQNIDLTNVNAITLWARGNSTGGNYWVCLDGCALFNRLYDVRTWTFTSLNTTGYTGSHELRLFTQDSGADMDMYIDDVSASISLPFITVYNRTITGFTANVTNGSISHGIPGERSDIQFNVTTVNDNATLWNWSFGDGNWTNGTTQNVTHTYTFPGNFTITEIASNIGGSNTTVMIDYIHIYDHVIPEFTANVTSGVFPLNVGFNVTNPADSATMWNWSFGDGSWQNGTSQNATYIYGTGGTYTVTEIASNPGDTHSYTLIDYITVYNHTISGFTSNLTICAIPCNVGFNVTKVNDNATMWNWSFGDGSWQNGTSQNVTHVYMAAGNYSVTEIASNIGDSNSTTLTDVISVYYNPSTVFIATPLSGSVPLTVIFNDTSLNGPTSWNWSFGDGTYSATKNTTHTYTISGSYTVILTTTNAYGSSNFSRIISALSALPIANFTASPNNGNPPLDVTFTDTSIGSVINWSWNFGDGSGSYLQNPVHTYSSLGTYPVSLTIQTPVGDNVSRTQYIYIVSNSLPIVDFAGTPTSGAVPLTTVFTDLTSGTVTGWNWSFGDGNYSNDKDPSHTYGSSGQYTVTLIATNGAGSAYKTYYGLINVGGFPMNSANVNFTYTKITNFTIQFTDTSICNPVCNKWYWDFDNDGSWESRERNPIYTFTDPRGYKIKLTAGNDFTGSSKIQSIIIDIPFVAPTLSAQPTSTMNQVMYKLDPNTQDIQNGTFMKYWLQNFTATGNFSIYGFAVGLMAPVMHVFGFWIYLIIWGLYLFAVWIRSQDVTLPLIIGILSIGTFGLLFPKEALPVIIIMFVVCGAIIITKLMKDSL